jgi:hypothetical protein
MNRDHTKPVTRHDLGDSIGERDRTIERLENDLFKRRAESMHVASKGRLTVDECLWHLLRQERLNQRNGGARIDTDQMLAKGAIEGPYRRTKPITLTLRKRIGRWLRKVFGYRAPKRTAF